MAFQKEAGSVLRLSQLPFNPSLFKSLSQEEAGHTLFFTQASHIHSFCPTALLLVTPDQIATQKQYLALVPSDPASLDPEGGAESVLLGLKEEAGALDP